MNTTQRLIRTAATLCLACALALPSASLAATWSTDKRAAGTYDWNDTANWKNGTLPTSATDALLNGTSASDRIAGNQTITGDGMAKTLDLHNNEITRSRTFTGDITASNLMLRVGTMNVEGTLNLTGSGQSYSIVGAAFTSSEFPNGILDIKSGGTVRADGVHALCVGRRADSGNTTAGGRIILRDGGTLVLNPSGATAGYAGILLGRSTDNGTQTAVYPASYVQEGGHATVGRFIAGFERGAYGAMSIQGGVLDLPYISTSTRFRVGHGGYGIFEQFGGDVFVNTNSNPSAITAPYRYDTTRNYGFEVGAGRSAANGLNGAYFYAQGGSFTVKGDFNVQGAGFNLTGVNPAHATIAGSAVVTGRTVRVGANTGDGKASLNLVGGGTLVTEALNSIPNRPGLSEINANGGKIHFTSSSVQEQGNFIDAVNIYEGGLEIQCDSGVWLGNAGTNVLLRTPGGYGVAISSVSTVGASPCPPWITVSGGSGSNAVAVALVDYTRNNSGDTVASGLMTNAVVVCPGEGFAAGDAVTASVYRPWGATQTSTDRVTLSLVENRPGALVKTGAATLNLFAQPEFAGTYEVRRGWMIQTTTAGVAAPNVAAVVVGGDNANFQCGSGNATAVEANWDPINPAATLTLGTDYGPGTLVLPRSSPTEAKPFRQTFASLAVNGTGNAITHNNNNGSTNGAVVAFGTISCAESSQLTIPDSKTGVVKVYCTGMPAGTALKNIVFAGDSAHTAMVGDDGQLVPMPLAFVMVVR